MTDTIPSPRKKINGKTYHKMGTYKIKAEAMKRVKFYRRVELSIRLIKNLSNKTHRYTIYALSSKK